MADWVYGDPVMILGMTKGPNQKADVGGRYWGEWPGNSKHKGKMRIMTEGVELAIDPQRVLRYQEYMDHYKNGTLPKEAAGRPWFLEGAS